MSFLNLWDNTTRADSYAALEFPGTYYLAYRDLPGIIQKYIQGTKALDFGCGTGRSTRFLKKLGFDAVGIDIADNMLEKARLLDPNGSYLKVWNGNYKEFALGQFNLIQSIFTFDNIQGIENRIEILKALKRLLKPNGKMILLDSTPEIYYYEWASFTTRSFPENKKKKDGEIVRIIMTDVSDDRPFEDVLWSNASYLECFEKAGLNLVEKYLPLGNKDEGIEWKSELTIAPWVVYVVSID